MMYRNPLLLAAVRRLPCSFCDAAAPSEAVHSNQLRDGKGRGIKAHDFRVASGCKRCHTSLDQGNVMEGLDREELFEAAHRKTIGMLFLRGWLQVIPT